MSALNTDKIELKWDGTDDSSAHFVDAAEQSGDANPTSRPRNDTPMETHDDVAKQI